MLKAGWWNGNPACWKWKVPGAAEVSRLAIRLEREQIKWTGDAVAYSDQELRRILMEEMHKERCAICGQHPRRLLTDHDHAAGLIRGYLCTACNTNEGINRGPGSIYDRYRVIHPALMCGVREMYYSSWGKPAVVLPAATDPAA